MSTAYYQYEIPDGQKPKTLDEALAAKKLIGARTFEKKKRCFTWQMQPAQFMYHAHFFGAHLGVIDEHGHMQLMANWLQELQNIDVMRYNRDDLLEEEDDQALASSPQPPALPEGVMYHDFAWPERWAKVLLPPDEYEKFMAEGSSSAPTLAELEQKLNFRPSPPITLPPGADPHGWPTVAPFLRKIGALAAPNNLYTFKYDLPEGKRGQQDVIAASLEDAFKRFGWVMDQFNLHPANITYGIEEHQAPAKEE